MLPSHRRGLTEFLSVEITNQTLLRLKASRSLWTGWALLRRFSSITVGNKGVSNNLFFIDSKPGKNQRIAVYPLTGDIGARQWDFSPITFWSTWTPKCPRICLRCELRSITDTRSFDRELRRGNGLSHRSVLRVRKPVPIKAGFSCADPRSNSGSKRPHRSSRTNIRASFSESSMMRTRRDYSMILSSHQHLLFVIFKA